MTEFVFFLCVCVFFFYFFRFFQLCFISSAGPSDRPRSFSLGFWWSSNVHVWALVWVLGLWLSHQKKRFFFRELHFLEPTKVATRGLTCLHTRRRIKSVILRGLSGRVWQQLDVPTEQLDVPKGWVQQPSSQSGDVDSGISECFLFWR